ncbi:YbaN family protein [Chloroflexota bacterium]
MGLGIIGIFVPVLPTTPFLLLAAACYVRSSQRFYSWLLHNKWFGSHIRNYLERKGILLRVKVVTIILLWITIGSSVALVVESLIVRLILVIIAVGVSIHILSVRTLK